MFAMSCRRKFSAVWLCIESMPPMARARALGMDTAPKTVHEKLFIVRSGKLVTARIGSFLLFPDKCLAADALPGKNASALRQSTKVRFSGARFSGCDNSGSNSEPTPC